MRGVIWRTATNRFMLSTEGTKIQEGDTLLRLGLRCSTTAEDGMALQRYHSFDARSWDKMPTDEEITAAIDKLIDELMGLREAPLAEPYTGPAILMNRASGVFFHEIFGHRIEGHRQKSEFFGQTFTKMVGEVVLPEFISVIDDPTRPAGPKGCSPTTHRGHPRKARRPLRLAVHPSRAARTLHLQVVMGGWIFSAAAATSPNGDCCC